MSAADKPPDDSPPFIVDSRGAKALHFAIGTIQSRMRLDEPAVLDLDYTRLMAAFALFVPEPAAITMVGLGGGSLAKYCQHQWPAARIDVVEISAPVIALRHEFQVPADGPLFQVHLGCGAPFVRQRPASTPVLLVDGFDGQGMPEALASQRFFDDCRQALLPGGVLVLNLHRDDPRHDALVARLRRSFADEAVLVVADDDGANSVVFAGEGELLRGYRPGLLRHPAGAAPGLAAPMLDAGSRVLQALAAQQLLPSRAHQDRPPKRRR